MQKTEAPKDNNIKLISMHDEMSSSYLSYAMSVIVSRALPDVRDGLKPVHRRILYAMYKGGYDWSKQFRKSARIVGDVIGKYHPHGDQSVYDALVRMVQDFSMSLPLVQGQGNFGSIDGDPAAAMRYTETRLSKVSQFLIDDIEKDTVSYKSNYDETEKEPTVLPAQYPNLLVNGAGGIAVGMATSIPPHNLGEIINGTLALIDNKDIKVKELMKHIPGPDFPTGGVIIGKDIIKQGYNKGRGSFKIRGEIKSTGEVMGVGASFAEAYAKAQMGAGDVIETSGNAFISVRDRDKPYVVEVAKKLDALGYSLVATHGTAKVIEEAGLKVKGVNKVLQGRPHVVDMLKNDEIQVVFNTTEGTQAIADSSIIRRTALRHDVYCTTTIAGALAVCEAVEFGNNLSVYTIQQLHSELH